jgi:hypothetical protein
MAPFLARRKTAMLAGLVALGFALRLFIDFSLGLKHDPWMQRSGSSRARSRCSRSVSSPSG